MTYVGRYINLNRSIERRGQMEAQFERLNSADRYFRFQGVDGASLNASASLLSPGERGCFLSHHQCIVDSIPLNEHVHIVEDDVTFGPQTVPLLDQIVDDVLKDVDILFTDIFVPPDFSFIWNLTQSYRRCGLIEDDPGPGALRFPSSIFYQGLDQVKFSGATSYIVAKRSAQKVADLLEAELSRGPTMPVDLALRVLVTSGQLSAVCTVPFLTSITFDSVITTTMTGRTLPPSSVTALFLLRHFFYVNKDAKLLRTMASNLNKDLQQPGFTDVLLESFKFILSDHYTDF